MTPNIRTTTRLRACVTGAILFALLPFTTSSVHATRGRTSVASGGTIGRALAMSSASDEPLRAAARRTLAQRAAGTYIREMLADRDSALARWPARARPLRVWIQPLSNVEGWNSLYLSDVRRAFNDWSDLHLPVRFAYTADSTHADVHVTFVDHFDEEISGRTRWSRDDDWWITDADIALAVYHRDGPRLDDDAMHAMSLHEIGHLLGLDHTHDSTSVMAPRVHVRALSAADRATVRLLYTLPPGGVR